MNERKREVRSEEEGREEGRKAYAYELSVIEGVRAFITVTEQIARARHAAGQLYRVQSPACYSNSARYHPAQAQLGSQKVASGGAL